MTYYGSNELARSFRTVRRNTIITAEEIPEAQYGFRPSPDSRSVGEVLAHIAVTSQSSFDTHAVRKLATFAGVDFPALAKARGERERQLTTRADILAALKGSEETWGRFLDRVTEDDLSVQVTYPEPMEPRSKSRFELILAVKEHEMHHRAQLMVMQRMLGLVPHLTRERQARMGPAAR